jgi:hypothetical protein
MKNLNEVAKSGADGDGNVQAKIDSAHGMYKDAAAASTDMMAKLPQASLPQAPDPTPFSIGPLGSK